MATCLSSSLPGLGPNLFSHVADALSLIWFRWTHLTDIRRHLPNFFLVNTFNFHDSAVDRNLDPLLGFVFDDVRIANHELDTLGRRFRLVSYASDLQRFGKAVRHSLNHVADESPCQPM